MSMLDGDPFDNGTPKYQSPEDIYDAVQAMASGEEIGIISEMFADVSWENQDYYYTDNGGKLAERWDKATDNGNKMWLMDVATWQMDGGDVNDWMYQILCNDDLARRIKFKKIFIDTVLSGMTSKFEEVSNVFADELRELDYFDFQQNSAALKSAMESVGYCVVKNTYRDLCSAVYDKLKGLRLEDERQLIADSRAMLTAYDDFMFGLKSNQYLYTQQENMYQQRVTRLQAKYESTIKALLVSAQAQGVTLQLPDAPLFLASSEAAQAGEDGQNG